MSNPLFLNHPHFRPLLPLSSSHMDLCLGLIREADNFMERNRIVDGIYGANQDALDVIKTYSFLHESEMAEAVNKLEGQEGRDAFLCALGFGRLLAWERHFTQKSARALLRVVGHHAGAIDHPTSWIEKHGGRELLVSQPYADAVEWKALFEHCSSNKLQLAVSFSSSWWYPGKTVLLAFLCDEV